MLVQYGVVLCLPGNWFARTNAIDSLLEYSPVEYSYHPFD